MSIGGLVRVYFGTSTIMDSISSLKYHFSGGRATSFALSRGVQATGTQEAAPMRRSAQALLRGGIQGPLIVGF